MGRFESIGPVQPFLKLHEGIWADVFKAYDASLERNVLLKKLKPEYASDEETAERFEAEARLMARIKHPNVVSVLSFGKSENAVYFVAEYIDGTSLDALLQQRRLPICLAAHILRCMTMGLQAAHAQNIFHRDLKPSNILISGDGEVKLTDFGMASLMEAEGEREVRGTLGYLAPELVFEGAPSRASDLFALGATFFEMLAGRAAFRGTSPSEMFDHVLNHDPIPFLAANPEIPAELIEICSRLLEKDHDHRYQDCNALLDDLNQFLGRAPTFSGKDSLRIYLHHPEDYAEPPISSIRSNLASPPTTTKEKRFYSRRPAITAALFAVIVIGSFGTLKQIAQPMPEPLSAGPLRSESAQSESETEADEPIASPADSSKPMPPRANGPVDTPATIPSSSAEITSQTGDSTSSEKIVTPVDDDSSVTEPSAPMLGELNLLCEPYCEVFVDDIWMGEAPPLLTMPLPPGPHRLTLKNPNLPDYSRDIVIEAGRRDTLMAPLRQLIGTVEIKVHPWAEVYIDSVHYGTIPPVQTLFLNPGVHALTLIHPSLGRLDTTLLVVEGEKLSPPTFNMKQATDP